jgi:hypothetical protein
MVTGPTPIQLVLPPAPRPSGVNTRSWSTPAPTSIGQASRLRVATDIRLMTSRTGTPRIANCACLRNSAYGDLSSASDSTLELDSTMTRPRTTRIVVAPVSR